MQRALSLLVLAPLSVAVLWAGCSDDETTTVNTTGTAGSPSTGTINPTATVTTTTTGGGGGAGGTAPSDPCNPVTNEGCDAAAGEACDTDYNSQTFRCYPPPNENELCAACGPNDGYCEATLTCFDSACAKYCCSDADCSSDAICHYAYLEDFPGEVGVCLTVSGGAGGGGAGGTAGAGGTGGAGGSGGAGGAGGSGVGGAGGGAPRPGGPDCDAPTASPSMGTCVPGWGGAGGSGGAAGAGGLGGSGGGGNGGTGG